MHSFENHRLMSDEFILFKNSNGQIDTQIDINININRPIRLTRQASTFYLSSVTTNIKYFAPILRMQRQHNETFNHEPNFMAFKRYIRHEVNEIQPASLLN